MSTSVTYTRDGFNQDFNATIGETEFIELNANDVETEVKYRDFIFVTSVFESVFDKPKRGDIITENTECETIEYQVISPSGEPLFRKDSYSLSIKIHTQRIKWKMLR